MHGILAANVASQQHQGESRPGLKMPPPGIERGPGRPNTDAPCLLYSRLDFKCGAAGLALLDVTCAAPQAPSHSGGRGGRAVAPRALPHHRAAGKKAGGERRPAGGERAAARHTPAPFRKSAAAALRCGAAAARGPAGRIADRPRFFPPTPTLHLARLRCPINAHLHRIVASDLHPTLDSLSSDSLSHQRKYATLAAASVARRAPSLAHRTRLARAAVGHQAARHARWRGRCERSFATTATATSTARRQCHLARCRAAVLGDSPSWPISARAYRRGCDAVCLSRPDLSVEAHSWQIGSRGPASNRLWLAGGGCARSCCRRTTSRSRWALARACIAETA
jgi:hypothetical protein